MPDEQYMTDSGTDMDYVSKYGRLVNRRKFRESECRKDKREDFSEKSQCDHSISC